MRMVRTTWCSPEGRRAPSLLPVNLWPLEERRRCSKPERADGCHPRGQSELPVESRPVHFLPPCSLVVRARPAPLVNRARCRAFDTYIFCTSLRRVSQSASTANFPCGISDLCGYNQLVERVDVAALVQRAAHGDELTWSNSLRPWSGRSREGMDSVRQMPLTSVRRRGSVWRNDLTSSESPSASVPGSPPPRAASPYAHCDGRYVTFQLISILSASR